MYPVVFDPARVRVVLAGDGEPALRRLRSLDAAGVGELAVFSPGLSAALAEAAGERLTRRLPVRTDFDGITLALVAGLDDPTSARVAAAARSAGVPVNVEDRRQWCDFHIPAVVRRGKLLLTVSTGGTAPGLAARLRRRLEGAPGPEWEQRLDALAAARARWQAEGAGADVLRRRTDEWIDRHGWSG